MLDTRVFGVRLDPLERRLGAGALDLELRDEHDRLPGRALREDDGTLVREEAEAREVLDVVLPEEHVAAQPFPPHVLEHPAAPCLQLGRRYPGTRLPRLVHPRSSFSHSATTRATRRSSRH